MTNPQGFNTVEVPNKDTVTRLMRMAVQLRNALASDYDARYKELQDALYSSLNVLPGVDKFPRGQVIQHVKTGGLYTVQMTPSEGLRLELSGAPAYLYMNADGVKWCRSQSEMEDGRFIIPAVVDQRV